MAQSVKSNKGVHDVIFFHGYDYHVDKINEVNKTTYYKCVKWVFFLCQCEWSSEEMRIIKIYRLSRRQRQICLIYFNFILNYVFLVQMKFKCVFSLRFCSSRSSFIECLRLFSCNLSERKRKTKCSRSIIFAVARIFCHSDSYYRR